MKQQKSGLLKDYPLVPPSDPEIQRLLRDAHAQCSKDLKKATVFFRLAGRKGYLPAYLLLAEQAQIRQDDPLLIDSMCALLTAPDVQKQLPKGLLSNSAMQLAALLRDPKNKREAEAHSVDIERIAKDWPILNVLKLSDSGQPKTRHSKEETKTKPEQSDFQRIKAAMAVKETPTPAQNAKRGAWKDDGASWRFVAQVPELTTLSKSKLDISKSDMRLTGPDGCVLRVETPSSLDIDQVEATWFRKSQQLEVSGPKSSLVEQLD
ncbi:unnamed protein product [Effrenium voratum]|nr:unnamed protein product [Effrenium voratum]